ncbi:hypothetical protein SmJEL517_g03043 [Synchytrium microbalum]|uniref:HIT-type domain-containing protein n=1 Tax=Synchytrium microbalum TaxID=1806994 RepID=A0A507CA11_9FUNG|nr:uncharacterized protein SmJEL517_g03043 [Synchytrium microbalum]TPX34383.1 hypothetical protein SmJEL517_g03043 [Synchytrium microbalum]
MPPKSSGKKGSKASGSKSAAKPINRSDRKAVERTSTRGANTSLDTASRARALQKRLDELERDNSGALPDVDLVTTVLQPVYQTGAGSGTKRPRGLADGENQDAPGASTKGRKQQVRRLLLLRKNLSSYIADSKFEQLPPGTPTYLTANAPPSKFPPRKICSVCGFEGTYACVKCGMRSCSIRCLAAHEETR